MAAEGSNPSWPTRRPHSRFVILIRAKTCDRFAVTRYCPYANHRWLREGWEMHAAGSVDRAHLMITDRGPTASDHSLAGLTALKDAMRELTDLPFREMFLEVSTVSTEALVWLAAQSLAELGTQGWQPDTETDTESHQDQQKQAIITTS